MTTLISFDVDGTLIHSIGERANKLHKDSFSAAFKEVFGVDGHIDVIPHHGGTDPLILIKVLVHYGIDKDTAHAKMPELTAAMNAYFTGNASHASDGLELLPGVKDLLTALSTRDDVKVCLVTGNMEPIGWGKMKALGVLGLFSAPNFGGFGSDFCSGNIEEMWHDRGELIKIAAQKCEAQLNGAGPIKARLHVGDTPMDVKAAMQAGAVPVGVLTGVFSEDSLLEAEPTTQIHKDLTDTAAVLKAWGLEG